MYAYYTSIKTGTTKAISPSTKMVTSNIYNIYETCRVPPMHFVEEEQYVLKKDQDLCSNDICGGCMRNCIQSLLVLKVSEKIKMLNITWFSITITYPINNIRDQCLSFKKSLQLLMFLIHGQL